MVRLDLYHRRWALCGTSGLGLKCYWLGGHCWIALKVGKMAASMAVQSSVEEGELGD